jgi:ATP-dependent Clp protease adaptor protein ClpS
MPLDFDEYEEEEGDVLTKPREEEELGEPKDYLVVLLNDNYTTREFVVEVLKLVFHKDPVEATRIMLNVHRKGRGTVGTYPYDIALTKVEQVHALAREYEYPLKCVIEEA